MTELEFYKWVNEHNIEYRWDRRGSSEDVIMWVYVHNLDSLFEMLSSPSLFDEGGIEVRLQEKCVAIWASDICGHWDLNLENIFGKD